MLSTKNKEILRKIMYAVETGGQVYGGADYSSLIEAYANTPTETAITIGAGQWFANEAKRLLQNILKAAPGTFRKYDTAGVEADLSKDWSNYQIKKTSAKAKAIKAIISTAEGKAEQDKLVDAQMEVYVAEAEALGVTDQAAAMMCANFRHHGGYSAMKRVLGKTAKPYTLDHIYAACQTDTGNQVGAYKSRQKFVYSTLKKMVENGKEESNVGVTAKQVVDIMEGWMNMSHSKGTHKPIIDLYNSHKPLARGYAVTYKDDYCDTTVSAAFIQACRDAGVALADVIGGTECGVEEHVKIFKRAGIWEEDGTIIPEIGYICVYNWDDKVQPNDGYSDHIGIVSSVNKAAGTFVVSEGNMSGGIVGKRTINIGYGCIRGFAKPKYAKATNSTPEVEKPQEKPNTGSQSNSETVYTVQPGDTLSGIAKKYGTTYKKLAKYNNIPDPDVISVGQKIRIPATGSKTEVPAAKPTTYTVKAGDCLYAIAKKYKTTVQVLVDLNGIKDKDIIHVGQVIKLPGTAGFFVGCRVRVKRTAEKYATGQKIASFVKGSSYQVIQVGEGRCLLSGIVSWVKNEDLTLL